MKYHFVCDHDGYEIICTRDKFLELHNVTEEELDLLISGQTVGRWSMIRANPQTLEAYEGQKVLFYQR